MAQSRTSEGANPSSTTEPFFNTPRTKLMNAPRLHFAYLDMPMPPPQFPAPSNSPTFRIPLPSPSIHFGRIEPNQHARQGTVQHAELCHSGSCYWYQLYKETFAELQKMKQQRDGDQMETSSCAGNETQHSDSPATPLAFRAFSA